MDSPQLCRLLFLASAWTFFGAAALAAAAPPYTTVDRVIAVLTIPAPFATLGLLLAFCLQPAWTGKKDGGQGADRAPPRRPAARLEAREGAADAR